MERQRGLIVERTGRKLTVLTKDGDLVTFRSSRQDVMPGMEIGVPSRSPAFFAWRRMVPVAALSIILVFTSLVGYQQYLYAQPLMAYVTLDYAGSIELEVNSAGLVKAATALDEAGQEALDQVDYRNEPAQKVVEALVKAQDAAKAATEGSGSGTPGAERPSQEPPAEPQGQATVVVAVVPVKQGPGIDNLQKKVTESASTPSTSKAPSGHEDVPGSTGPQNQKASKQVTTFRLDMETRDSAKELGVSAGRAAMWALSKHAPTTGTPTPGQVTPGQVTPGQVTPGQVTPGQVTPGMVTPGSVTPSQEPSGHGQQGGGSGGKTTSGESLDDVKSGLPKVDLTDLEKHQDAEERDKYMKEITKDWVNGMVEEIRKGKQPDSRSEDASGDSGKSGSGSSSGHDSSLPGQSKPGKDNAVPPSSGGKSSPTSQDTGSGQGSGQQPGREQAPQGSGKDSAQGSGDSSKSSGEWLRRFQWWK